MLGILRVLPGGPAHEDKDSCPQLPAFPATADSGRGRVDVQGASSGQRAAWGLGEIVVVRPESSSNISRNVVPSDDFRLYIDMGAAAPSVNHAGVSARFA
jgi:hypothetical protein